VLSTLTTRHNPAVRSDGQAVINWAFVPLLIFIAVRSWLQQGPLYSVAVVAGGLLLGLVLRWRLRRRRANE
jgi:Flp pilus assembly protein TadB